MNLMVSWQLMLFICAISFRETLEKVAPMENPRSTDQQRRPPALPPPWEPSRPRAPPRSAQPGRPVLCAAGGRRTPRNPRTPREKDLAAHTWNSFGLRFGRRRAAPDGLRAGGARRGAGQRGHLHCPS